MAMSNMRFRPPPGWPGEDNWSPPEGWRPNRTWPAPPDGWQFWEEVQGGSVLLGMGLTVATFFATRLASFGTGPVLVDDLLPTLWLLVMFLGVMMVAVCVMGTRRWMRTGLGMLVALPIPYVVLLLWR